MVKSRDGPASTIVDLSTFDNITANSATITTIASTLITTQELIATTVTATTLLGDVSCNTVTTNNLTTNDPSGMDISANLNLSGYLSSNSLIATTGSISCLDLTADEILTNTIEDASGITLVINGNNEVVISDTTSLFNNNLQTTGDATIGGALTTGVTNAGFKVITGGNTTQNNTLSIRPGYKQNVATAGYCTYDLTGVSTHYFWDRLETSGDISCNSNLHVVGDIDCSNATIGHDLDVNNNLDVTGTITSSTGISTDGNVTCTNLYCADLYVDTIDLSSVSVVDLDVSGTATINSLIVDGNFTYPASSAIGVYAGLYPSTSDSTLMIKADSGSTNLMQILYDYGTTNFIKMVLDPATGLYYFKYHGDDIYTANLFGTSFKKSFNVQPSIDSTRATSLGFYAYGKNTQTDMVCEICSDSSANQSILLFSEPSDASGGSIIYDHPTNKFTIGGDDNNVINIDCSNVLVGIGSGTPTSCLSVFGSHTSSNQDYAGIFAGIQSDNNVVVEIVAGSTKASILEFTRIGSASKGRFIYNHSTDTLDIRTNNITQMTIVNNIIDCTDCVIKTTTDMSANNLISNAIDTNSIDTNLISCATDLPFYRGVNKKMEIVSNATNVYDNLILKNFSALQAVSYTTPAIQMGVYDALLGNPYIQLNSQNNGDCNIYFTDVSSSLGYIKYNHTASNDYMLFAVDTLPRLYLYTTNANFTDLDIKTTGDVSCNDLSANNINVINNVDCSGVIATDVSCSTVSNATLTACDANACRGQLLTYIGGYKGTLSSGFQLSYGNGEDSFAQFGMMVPCNVRLKRWCFGTYRSSYSLSSSSRVVFRLHCNGAAQDVYAYCDFSITGAASAGRVMNPFSSSSTSQVDIEPEFSNVLGLSLAWETLTVTNVDVNLNNHRFSIICETIEDLSTP